jgi:hypothetical protein
MYDELVKRLRDAAKMSEALAVLLPNSDGSTTAKLYNEAADAIEKTKWIPLAERLPYESVFVHGKGGELVVAQYSYKHKWWEDDEGYYCDTNYVTHWMPLPEPPKEE